MQSDRHSKPSFSLGEMSELLSPAGKGDCLPLAAGGGGQMENVRVYPEAPKCFAAALSTCDTDL